MRCALSQLGRSVVFLSIFAVVITGCGGGGGASQTPPPNDNLTPTITSLVPSSAVEGASAETLTIDGTNFMSSSTVDFNGSARAATFVSSSEMTISLTASDLSTIGSYAVVVINPAPGGGDSNTDDFQVTAPAPAITSLAPNSATAGVASQTLTINGSNFVSGATVTYNGVAHAVTFVSATQLTITLSAGDQATAGTFAVVVTNPDSQTASANFTVDNPAPAITGFSPASTYPCDPVPTLTINGSNFAEGATVTYNGVAKVATFVSATQLTIPLTTADISTPGNIPVIVTNPAPGGGDSPAANFPVNTPTGQTLAGTAPLSATLKVYEVNADGTDGPLLCTSATDAQTGAFSVTLDSTVVGAAFKPSQREQAARFIGVTTFRLITTGGQIPYSYASNGATQTADYTETSPDSALLMLSGSQSGIQIGMLSTFVDTRAQAEMAHGQANLLSTAQSDATRLLNGFYGLSGATAIELIPSGTATSDSTIRTLAENAVFNEALSLNLTQPGDLRGALAADLSDGVWDGLAFGSAVTLEGINQPATAGNTDFLDSAVNWVHSSAAAVWGNGVTAPIAPIVQGVTACSCTPFGVGLRPGNTSGIASLAFGGHQYLFIAAGTNGIDVVDVSDPTATSPVVKAWPGISSTTFSGAAVNGVAAIIGNADHPQIFAFTGGDQQVAVLNAVTLATGNPQADNPQEYAGTLGLTSQTPIQLSGSQWMVTGAFWDGCFESCRVILATADGYTSFNPAANQLDENLLYPVDDSSEKVTGNVGPASAEGVAVTSPTAGTHRAALAANRGGIQLVDFSAGASFYIPDGNPFWATYLPGFPQSPSDDRYDDGDGNAMDETYQVGILNAEGINSIVGLVNLNGITETTGGTAAQNTFSPAGAVQVTLASNANGFAVEGSSINPNTHQALLEGPGYVITVAQIQNPATSPWLGFADWAFYSLSNSPSLNGFQNPDSDLHPITTVTSLGTVKAGTLGIAYGYILDTTHSKLLEVDLGGFLSLTRQGASGDAQHQPSGDPATSTSATTGGAVVQAIALQ